MMATSAELLELGQRIRALRRARGLTQEQLAGLVGLERTSITNIESGNQQVTLSKLILIAEALGYELVLDFRPVIRINRDQWR